MLVSCAFPTALDSPHNIAMAERRLQHLAPGHHERSRDEVRHRLDAYREQGVTEIVVQPSGQDLERELERVLDAALTH